MRISVSYRAGFCFPAAAGKEKPWPTRGSACARSETLFVCGKRARLSTDRACTADNASAGEPVRTGLCGDRALSYAQIKGISDSELMELLAGGRTADARYGELGAWFERCTRELKRVGVTIQQLWEEYRQEQPDGYSYSQFCYHFQVWRDGDEVTR